MSAIFTKAELITYLGATVVPDVLATQTVAAMNAFVDRYTHRSFGEIKTVIDEQYDFKSPLWLRHQDVTSVDGIKIGYPNTTQTPIGSGNYFFNSYGRITLYWGQKSGLSTWNNDLLSVSYKHGVSTVPDDLKLACLGIAAAMCNFAINNGQDVIAQSIGSYRLQTMGSIRSNGIPEPAMNRAQANWQVIDAYKLRRA